MKKAKPLSEQFAEAQDRLAEAEQAYAHIRSAYFLERRQRAARGEKLEPLLCTDANAWNDQLHREQLAREHAQADREAGLAPAA
jgi:ABC-type transporter lipoprotein component MlaA